MKDNIYYMRESSASFYGLPDFIEKTQNEKSKGRVGIIPGTYATDVDFDNMSKEKGQLSKFIKDLVDANRYNSSVRNLTIYTTLLLQYIGGMLREEFIIFVSGKLWIRP